MTPKCLLIPVHFIVAIYRSRSSIALMLNVVLIYLPVTVERTSCKTVFPFLQKQMELYRSAFLEMFFNGNFRRYLSLHLISFVEKFEEKFHLES